MKSGLVNEPVWPVTSTITEFIFIPRRQQKPSSSEMMMPFQTTHSGRRKAIVQSRESNHSHSSRMGYRIFRYCEVHKFSRFSHFIHNRDKDFGSIFIRVRFRRILRSSLFAFLLRSKLSGQAGDSHFKDDERWALLASYNTVTRITSDPTSLSRELFTISSVRGECMRD